MKNYLIITLGTRDVQLRKDLIEQSGEFEIQQNGRNTILVQGDTKLAVFWNENFPLYYIISPREGGEIIEKNPKIFAPYLEFPLIEDVLSQLITTEKIDYLLIVFTDQEKDWLNGKIKIKKNYADDTLYFKDIVWRTLKHNHKWKNVTFDEYVVETDVANIDYQYTHFKEVKSELFLIEPQEIGQIFLLPQGGIDQINHAITLQLLQAFKRKVKLFQKAEGNVPRQLQFTNYFLQDLNKQKIVKHLNDYDFKLIDNSLISNETIITLARYASMRLFLQHDQLHQLQSKLLDFSFLRYEKDAQIKLVDLYLAAKIDLRRKNYYDLLWRLYTLHENLFRVKCESVLGSTSAFAPTKGVDKHPGWIKALKADPELLPILRIKGIKLDSPNRRAFVEILPHLFKNDSQLPLLQKIAEKLTNLANQRNQIAHQLGTTDLNQINQLLGHNYTLNNLMGDLDAYFGISEFGIFDQIKAEIEKLL